MCPHALFLQAQSHNYDNLVTVSIVVNYTIPHYKPASNMRIA